MMTKRYWPSFIAFLILRSVGFFNYISFKFSYLFVCAGKIFRYYKFQSVQWLVFESRPTRDDHITCSRWSYLMECKESKTSSHIGIWSGHTRRIAFGKSSFCIGFDGASHSIFFFYTIQLPAFIWSEEYQKELLSRHFKAFDILRRYGWFIGEFIWNYADFKTNQGETKDSFNSLRQFPSLKGIQL